MNRECGITTVDEVRANLNHKVCDVIDIGYLQSEIPENWRAAALSKVEMPSQDFVSIDLPYAESTRIETCGQLHKLPGCYYRDSDFCFLDDMSEGDYVDLSLNPERFTGYTGPSAHRVWRSIYEENCFGMSEFDTLGAMSNNNGPNGLAKGRQGEGEGVCLEQRVYYKIISGMSPRDKSVRGVKLWALGLHASISTHICHEDFNQTTGQWVQHIFVLLFLTHLTHSQQGPNLQCFIDRIASYPERLQYIYFNTVLLLRAVARIGPYLSAYDYCGDGTHEKDVLTLDKLNSVVSIAQNVGKFDEKALFRGENAKVCMVNSSIAYKVLIGYFRS